MSDKPENKGTPAFEHKNLNPKAPDHVIDRSSIPKTTGGTGVGASVQPKAPLPETTDQIAKPPPPSSDD